MCGIIGAWGSASKRLMDGISHVAHRGPDDVGNFIDEQASLALGHTRLSILDLSALGHQPMVSADGSTVLVFNGEIYNFKDLRADLIAKGYEFCSRTDTEVLLNLYAAYGLHLLNYLNGIFSFAIWDRKKQLLFIARDGLGVKPLYYGLTEDGLVFSSEIKALLKLLPELGQLDPVALHRYLNYSWCPGEGVPLKSVRKLPPGDAMLIRKGEITRRWTWYERTVFQAKGENISRVEAVDGTLKHLRQAVRRQLIADVPVGAFLSGGIDSSAVVAMAREQVDKIQCFTIEIVGGTDQGSQDDLPYARRVARHLGVPLEVLTINSSHIANDIEKMVYLLDEPLADPASLNVLYISELARQHGIKVLLSGVGGDDLFTGYRRHLALNMEWLWSWLSKGVRASLSTYSNALDQRTTISRRLSSIFAYAGESEDIRIAGYLSSVRESSLRSLYSEEFIGMLGEVRADQPLIDFVNKIPKTASKLQKLLALEQRFFLADHNLNYTDKMSMAAGVEVRVPFLDLELVRFASRIPDQFKQRGFVSKWCLKQAMVPYLPHEVIHRSKTGFGLPMRRWMRVELRELMGDYLSISSLKQRGLFNPAAVQRLIIDNDTGRIDGAYLIFSLLCIEIWCRQFIDGVGSYQRYYGNDI